jgi:hypothetical protein
VQAAPASLLAGAACQDKPDEAQPRPNSEQQGAINRAPYDAANKSQKSLKSL